MQSNTYIRSLGTFLPDSVVTNHDFQSKFGLDTNHEWILTRTGISERRIAKDYETSAYMGAKAAEKAIESANLSPNDIDLILVATTSPDHSSFPSTACLIQHKLNMKHVGAMDISAACTGFIYALTTAHQFLQSDQYSNILVIGVDSLSKLVNWKDRSTCILFGDGAGAAIVSKTSQNKGIIYSQLHADGSKGPILQIPEGGTQAPFNDQTLNNNKHTIYMDGRQVMKVAIQSIIPSIKDALKNAKLSINDIDYFIPHQANIRIIDQCTDKLGFKPEQVLKSIQHYGNTSAASIPLTLYDYVESGTIKDGHTLLLAGFGAGFTWGVTILKWSNKYE